MEEGEGERTGEGREGGVGGGKAWRALEGWG